MSVGGWGKEGGHHCLDDDVKGEREVNSLGGGAVLRLQEGQQGEVDVGTQRRGNASYAQDGG